MATKPKTPSDIADKNVAVRAHQIWQEAGEPDGRSDAHWEQARKELAGRKPGPAGKKAPKAKP